MKRIMTSCSIIALFVTCGRSDANCLDYGAHLHRVAGLNVSFPVSEVDVVGNHAYLANDFRGVKVVDISNPVNPIPLMNVDTPGLTIGVTAAGNRLYAANQDGGISIIDITNPEAPLLLSNLDTPGQANNIAVNGNLLYVADNSTIKIVNVSDPAAPVIVGSCSVPARDVVISDGKLYVASGGSHIQIWSLANPTAPTKLGAGSGPPTGYGTAIDLSGSYAYIADSQAGLRIYDVSNPAMPVQVALVPTTSDAEDVRVAGTALFLAFDGGLKTFDISNPSQPLLIGELTLPFGARGIDVQGTWAYVAVSDGSTDFLVLDADNPATVLPIASYNGITNAGGVALLGADKAVVSGTGGLHVIDVSNPDLPLKISSVPGLTTAAGVAMSGNLAFVVGQSLLHVIDVSDPTNPIVIDSLSLAGTPQSVAVHGDKLVVSCWDYGIRIIDVADPMNPVEIGSAPTAGFAGDLVTVGDLAYVPAYTSGLQIFDITDPAAPFLVKTVDTPGAALAVSVADDHAYVSDNGDFVVIDVGDPLTAHIVSQLDLLATGEIAVFNSLAAVSSSYRGVDIVDISDPTQPVYIGYCDTPGTATAVIQLGTRMLVADGAGGMQVTPAPCTAVSGVPTGREKQPALFLQPWPNPSSSRVNLTFLLHVDTPVDLFIADISGRRIRQLFRGDLESGVHYLEWDGTDAREVRVASGIYFAALAWKDGREVIRITISR